MKANVNNDVPGAVAVWGHGYQKHTILVQDGYFFYLIQFDNNAYFNEWMEQNSDKYKKITFIEEV